MDKETREALLGSIEKWKRIVAGTGEDHGATQLPIMQHVPNYRKMRGCPFVRKRDTCCLRSPYVDYMRYQHSGAKYTERLASAAEAELAFLQSLLPPESGE